MHMPMQTVPQRHAELEAEAPVVCICHHGMRSMQVGVYLDRAGFENVYNLTGGVEAWAVQVDPAMQRY